MKKTKLPVRAEEFEKKHIQLHHNDFHEYLFGLKMDYWQYLKLKEDFINIYKEDSSKNKTYSLVNELCNVLKKIEIENFKKGLQEKLEALSFENKLAVLENELEQIKKEWSEVVPESIKSLDLISTYSNLGIDETYEEPIEYYREIANFLNIQIDLVKKEIWIENTRIIDNLYHSLRNFYYEDWIKKALKEAPGELEESLAYFIRINTDLKKIKELEKERKPKANYFDLTRFAKYNAEGEIIDGPTSNYDRYIEWTKSKVDLIEKKLLNSNYNINNENIQVTTGIKSFNYKHLQTKPSNISDLFNSLKKSNLIDGNTKLIDFKKIFSGIDLFKPIIWIGDKQDLSYFIKLIHGKYNLVDKVENKGYWNVAIKCFIKSDGSSFDKKELIGAKKPTYHEKIETIAKLL